MRKVALEADMADKGRGGGGGGGACAKTQQGKLDGKLMLRRSAAHSMI
jgi:hypothetical protein